MRLKNKDSYSLGEVWTGGGRGMMNPFGFREGEPTNAKAATGKLTLSGVVKHGETLTIGKDKYQLTAHKDKTVDEGFIAVDITDVTVASQGLLTLAVNPVDADEDTITIGEITYKFVDAVVDVTDVKIGNDVEATQANLVEVINATHPDVTIGDFEANDAVITANVGGIAGDLIETVSDFESESNLFDGVTLGTETAGVDCTNANGATKIIAIVGGDDSVEPITPSAGTTGVVLLTADAKGAEYFNDIGLTETLANGAFENDKMTGGKNGTLAKKYDTFFDGTYLYIATDDNDIKDSNWKKVEFTLTSL